MSERTPLRPIIDAGTGPMKLCSCCQGTDRVTNLRFGWIEWEDEHPSSSPRPHSGAQTVAICWSCRQKLRAVIRHIDGADNQLPKDDEEALEAAYWFFDALHKGTEKKRKEAGLGPLSEREAFKAAARNLLCRHQAEIGALSRELERWRHGQMVEGDFVCPNELEATNLRSEQGETTELLRSASRAIMDIVAALQARKMLNRKTPPVNPIIREKLEKDVKTDEQIVNLCAVEFEALVRRLQKLGDPDTTIFECNPTETPE